MRRGGSSYLTLWHRLVAQTAEPSSSCGCWLWQAQRDRYGYGRYNLWVPACGGALKLTAHVSLWLLSEGVEAGADAVASAHAELHHSRLDLDHLCRQAGCVNPDHLELVSWQENQQRRLTRIAAKTSIFDQQPPGAVCGNFALD